MTKKIIAAAAAVMLLAASFVSAEPIPTRGIIEGFYGTPWTHQQRLDLIAFAADRGLNAYIYAPKDDPFHREKWREPYPDDQINQLAELITAANQSGVDFIFAVSPGLDLNYSDSDFTAMIQKLDAVHNIGCNHFAVFFDDIEDLNGAAQAAFLNRIQREYVAVHEGIKPLITVPTEYYRRNMIDDNGNVKEYTRAFAGAIDGNILVLFTGDGVVCPELNEEQLKAANQIYGRELGVWWNYPVNDYMTQKLALGPVINLPTKLPAIFFNPMSAFELSKIALSTAADYSNDPVNYDPQQSWMRAIERQFGTISGAMMIFAEHSQHMKNNWAEAGRQDAPSLRAEFEMLLNGVDRYDVVNTKLVEAATAVRQLKTDLPPKIYNECRLQLDQFERLIEAAQIATDILKYRQQSTTTDQLQQMLQSKLMIIDHNAKEALISEECLYQFIKRVLDAQ